MTGYLNPLYAESFSGFGRILNLPLCGGYILERVTPFLQYHDAMGLYPLFCCVDWQMLKKDLDQLDSKIVSLCLVTDPFGNYSEPLLNDCFDLVKRYKEHFIVDVNSDWEKTVSSHHKKYAKKALNHVKVEVCANPLQYLQDWVTTYDFIIQRFSIVDYRRFLQEAFARQLSVPGIVMFSASVENEIVGLDLWYVQNNIAYGHLVAFNPTAYRVYASYALKYFILHYFSGKVLFVDLGGGVSEGLTKFKKGWTSITQPTYLCGKVFDPHSYNLLKEASGNKDSDYFPVYRYDEKIT